MTGKEQEARDAYEIECQNRMRAALDEVNRRLTVQDGAIAEIREVQNSHARQLAEGTALMRGLDDKVTTLTSSTNALTEATRPVVDAVVVMQAGVVFLGKLGQRAGRVGKFFGTLGEWGWKVAKLGALLAASWVFVKSVLLGQPLASAWGDFMRFIR